MIGLAEAHALLASNRDLIAQTWNFFMSVHMGLFAALLFSPTYGGRRLHLNLLIVFYAGFAYLNYHAQLDNYTYARKLLDYIADLESKQNGLKLVEVSFQRGWLIPYLAPLYISVGVFTGGLIFISSLAKPRTPVSEKKDGQIDVMRVEKLVVAKPVASEVLL